MVKMYDESLEIRELAYAKYQLYWMIEHGHSIKELMQAVNDYDHEYADDTLMDRFEQWDEEEGFKGSLWVCMDEFLGAEYQDKAYMRGILTDTEYAAYLDDIGEGYADFAECVTLINTACVNGVLNHSVTEQDGDKTILVGIVRDTGLYYEPLSQVARDLMFDKEGRETIQSAIDKKVGEGNDRLPFDEPWIDPVEALRHIDLKLLAKQKEWLYDQFKSLEPSGEEASAMPEGILNLLDAIGDAAEEAQKE